MTNDINNDSKTLDLEGKVSMIVGLAGQEAIEVHATQKVKMFGSKLFLQWRRTMESSDSRQPESFERIKCPVTAGHQ